MNIKSVLNELNFSVDSKEMSEIKKESNVLIKEIKAILKKNRIKAEVFLGGSFAKGTIVRSNEYDIDIFVRFDSKYEDISEILENAIKKVKGYRTERVHGSRDYFKLVREKDKVFEIIPVVKIKNPKEARNVTDLSYFHVNYVKKKLKGKMANEVIFAKAFCKALGVYGAESYINGFSGYALECLIIYYGSLEKMLKELIKAKGKVIIDSAKFYKKKEEILLTLNESRLQSPIIIVDPTWKERNVAAALNKESFDIFIEGAKKFIKNPKKEFFEEKKFDEYAFRNKSKGNDFVHLILKTDKQEGDIAGTKMKNFSKFLIKEIEKSFDVIDWKFEYEEGKESDLFIIAKGKKEILRKGPPVEMKDACVSFKKFNNKVFEKSGTLYGKIEMKENAEAYLKGWIKKYSETVGQMDIIEIRVYN